MAAVRSTQIARTTAAGLLLAAIIFTLAPSRAAVQEVASPADRKYGFRVLAAAGDSRVVDDVLDMSMDLVVTVGGQEVPSRFTKRSREAYTEEVLAAANGKPTLLWRKYTAHRESETGPDGKTKVKVSSLQGKTVTVRISGRKVTVTAAKGKLVTADLKQLQEKYAAGGDDTLRLLPNRELGPGEEWVVPPEVVARVFRGMEKGEVKGRFEQILEHAGHSLAEFRLDLALETTVGTPVPMTLKGTGAAFYDLKLKREWGASFGGPIALEGDFEQNGQKLRMVGTGKMDARQTVRWLKVAGKPVNAPAYAPPPPPGAPPAGQATP